MPNNNSFCLNRFCFWFALFFGRGFSVCILLIYLNLLWRLCEQVLVLVLQNLNTKVTAAMNHRNNAPPKTNSKQLKKSKHFTRKVDGDTKEMAPEKCVLSKRDEHSIFQHRTNQPHSTMPIEKALCKCFNAFCVCVSLFIHAVLY